MRRSSVERPDRSQLPNEKQRLAREGKPKVSPALKSMTAAEINQCPSIFQPRGDQLLLYAGKSADHVAMLVAAIKQSRKPLEPVDVVRFGSSVYLINGHHRMKAYQEAGWTNAIPVNEHQSQLDGKDRVDWAERTSYTLNSHNRLNLSDREKADALWRAVAQGIDGSKAEASAAYGLGTTTVANMRKIKSKLVAAGKAPEELCAWDWQRAIQEAMDRDSPDVATDYDERKRQLLARALKPVLNQGPSAEMLLDVLEAGRSGIITEITWAIEARQQALRDLII